MSDANTPVVGAGATQHYPQDKLGYVVLGISPIGHRVKLAALKQPDLTTGHRPTGQSNGLPVWGHEYTPDELAGGMRYQRYEPIAYAFRRSDGRYYLGGHRITFDGAYYCRNWAD